MRINKEKKVVVDGNGDEEESLFIIHDCKNEYYSQYFREPKLIESAKYSQLFLTDSINHGFKTSNKEQATGHEIFIE